MEQPLESGRTLRQVRYTVSFQEPAFKIAKESHIVQGRLFHALRPFDLSWPDFHEVGISDGPTRWCLSAKFLNFMGTVQVRTDRLELNILGSLATTVPATTDPPLAEVAERIEEAVVTAIDPILFAEREISFEVHLDTDDLASASIRGLFGPRPAPETLQGLGELVGRGGALYFEHSLFHGECSIVFDRSAAIEDGFYAQIQCQFDAARFTASATVESFHQYLEKVDGAFHLDGALLG